MIHAVMIKKVKGLIHYFPIIFVFDFTAIYGLENLPTYTERLNFYANFFKNSIKELYKNIVIEISEDDSLNHLLGNKNLLRTHSKNFLINLSSMQNIIIDRMSKISFGSTNPYTELILVTNLSNTFLPTEAKTFLKSNKNTRNLSKYFNLYEGIGLYRSGLYYNLNVNSPSDFNIYYNFNSTSLYRQLTSTQVNTIIDRYNCLKSSIFLFNPYIELDKEVETGYVNLDYFCEVNKVKRRPNHLPEYSNNTKQTSRHIYPTLMLLNAKSLDESLVGYLSSRIGKSITKSDPYFKDVMYKNSNLREVTDKDVLDFCKDLSLEDITIDMLEKKYTSVKLGNIGFTSIYYTHMLEYF